MQASVAELTVYCLTIDGILSCRIGTVLVRGTGKLHGIDSSPAMIEAARKLALKMGISHVCTFEGQGLHFAYPIHPEETR